MASETYSIYDNGGKYGARNRLAVLGVVGAPYEFVVVVSVEAAENQEDDNGEDGNNHAVYEEALR